MPSKPRTPEEIAKDALPGFVAAPKRAKADAGYLKPDENLEATAAKPMPPAAPGDGSRAAARDRAKAVVMQPSTGADASMKRLTVVVKGGKIRAMQG
jgi:hypothetical protein